MEQHDKLTDILAQLERLEAQITASVFGPGWVCLNGTLIVPEFKTLYALALLPDGIGTHKTMEAIIHV